MLPTRVLDLDEPGTVNPMLRLQVNEIETHGSYLALSYCWGKRDPSWTPIELRTDNLDSLVSGIDFERLPRSIQDAIIVTRDLGFRYLWVDSLCITQDDEVDKSREISQMASIYKNAAVTIAAGIAEKASEGFLARQTAEDKAYLPGYRFHIPMPGGKVGEVYLAVEDYEPDHPLDKRGWTLQEFMLSSRLLIFSDYELLWQCKEVPLRGVVSEGGLGYRQRIESLPWTVFDESAEPDFGSHDFDKVYLWKTIIHQFTDRELSYGEDRLRAVEGVVSELESLWRDSNVYGHWKGWFVKLLSWYKPDVDRVEERHLERAPSWSWVSIDGGIRYEETFETEDARVKSLTVEKVVLTCRMLGYEDIVGDMADSVRERPDLKGAAVMAEVGERDCEYLLLGQSRTADGCGRGLGLLVLPTSGGEYRRVGLAEFLNMSIWEGVEPRDITLEPKM
ncbi:related to protein TOL [Cephalotrichum gorgonifer]|uniref:Related to protein TOL n=1 Tax=Cephalotrichum gorgonifer TaxID=2041049 RepID=A0AAE8N4F2_9PEZI|nr:related to protein TOL [Cephalotrichum gorgonifer]